ncbi:unnamed protein product [Rhizophagus irregularis]|nr:unnamed protein product [Rhizophagus irregularis]
MARTTLKSYFLPHQSNSLAAKAHHHSAWVAVAGVSRTEMREHLDSHYCLASVKCAKQFSSTFANVSVIISQDDKAKIGLGCLHVFNDKPNESNDELQTGRLAIFVRPQ